MGAGGVSRAQAGISNQAAQGMDSAGLAQSAQNSQKMTDAFGLQKATDKMEEATQVATSMQAKMHKMIMSILQNIR